MKLFFINQRIISYWLFICSTMPLSEYVNSADIEELIFKEGTEEKTFEYGYRLNPEDTCNTEKDVELLIGVAVNRKDFRLRQKIRQTWGKIWCESQVDCYLTENEMDILSEEIHPNRRKRHAGSNTESETRADVLEKMIIKTDKEYKLPDLLRRPVVYQYRVLFFLGSDHFHDAQEDLTFESDKSSSFYAKGYMSSEQLSIETESDRYGDVVQGTFFESVENSSLKSLSILNWAITYCARASFVVKVDADVYLNIRNLINELRYKYSSFSEAFVAGTEMEPQKILVNLKNSSNHERKYTIIKSPKYTSASCYAMTMQAAILIINTCDWLEFKVRDENLLVTGLCRDEAKVSLIPISPFDVRLSGQDDCQLAAFIAARDVTLDEMSAINKEVLDAGMKCINQKKREFNSVSKVAGAVIIVLNCFLIIRWKYRSNADDSGKVINPE